MTQIRVDEFLRSKLHNFTTRLEICDDNGKILARVEPVSDPAWIAWEPPYDEEELRRREQSTKRYTTEEVLARLKSLENK